MVLKDKIKLVNAYEIAEFPFNDIAGTNEIIDEEIFTLFTDDIIDKYGDRLNALCWRIIKGYKNVIMTSDEIQKTAKYKIIHKKDGFTSYKVCTNCNYPVDTFYESNYCPNCGFKITK